MSARLMGRKACLVFLYPRFSVVYSLRGYLSQIPFHIPSQTDDSVLIWLPVRSLWCSIAYNEGMTTRPALSYPSLTLRNFFRGYRKCFRLHIPLSPLAFRPKNRSMLIHLTVNRKVHINIYTGSLFY